MRGLRRTVVVGLGHEKKGEDGEKSEKRGEEENSEIAEGTDEAASKYHP